MADEPGSGCTRAPGLRIHHSQRGEPAAPDLPPAHGRARGGVGRAGFTEQFAGRYFANRCFASSCRVAAPRPGAGGARELGRFRRMASPRGPVQVPGRRHAGYPPRGLQPKAGSMAGGEPN